MNMNTFPVTESTLSALHLGKLLQEKYLLSISATCSLLRTGMNHLYLFTDGDSQYVFRVYTFNWRTSLEIAEEVRLLLHLKNSKCSVSYPIADRSGNYVQEIEAPEGLRYGVLFSFAKGEKNARFTADASHQIGCSMAMMHQITENFALQRICYNTQTLLIDSYSLTRFFFKKATAETAFVEKLTNYLQRENKTINHALTRRGALHLDIWFDNMHITPDNEVTFFDFDFCGNGLLCLDVSYFLYQLFNTHPDTAVYEQKAEAFLKGYESIRPLTSEEKRLLPTACLQVMLFYLSMQCLKFDTWSNIFLNEDHLKRYTTSLQRWIAFHQLAIC